MADSVWLEKERVSWIALASRNKAAAFKDLGRSPWHYFISLVEFLSLPALWSINMLSIVQRDQATGIITRQVGLYAQHLCARLRTAYRQAWFSGEGRSVFLAYNWQPCFLRGFLRATVISDPSFHPEFIQRFWQQVWIIPTKTCRIRGLIHLLQVRCLQHLLFEYYWAHFPCKFFCQFSFKVVEDNRFLKASPPPWDIEFWF